MSELEPPTEAMEQLAVSVSAPPVVTTGAKGHAKRDALRLNEVEVQAMWERERAFEADASPDREKFIVTFPYPYSNGMLHIGHAFSLTKAVFRAQFERHQGKNVLFPFAFHCTGMPIQAVSIVTSFAINHDIIPDCRFNTAVEADDCVHCSILF